MASLSRFSDVWEEELNSHIQKAVPEKTKLGTRYGIKIVKGKKKINLNYQFEIFTRRQLQTAKIKTRQTWPFKKRKYFCKKYCCSFVFSSKISTETITKLALNFYCQSIEITSSYYYYYY